MRTDLEEPRNDRECPFLAPAQPGRSLFGIYCRLPGGRVRIPTAEERVRFCQPGKHAECPVYERHAHRA